MKLKGNNPWLWVPTLYLFEGIPYAVVNNISLVMFKDMGMPNDRLSIYTSLLSIPWVLKIVLSPFVDSVASKRQWATLMQVLMVVCTLALGLLLPKCSLSLLLILFSITAFASATHDIAADGYYMLALDDHQQSLFVGIRSTFFRIATVCGQGLIVVLAGKLEKSMAINTAWSFTLVAVASILALIALWDLLFLPRPAADSKKSAVSSRVVFRNLAESFITFFTKKGIIVTIFFLLLYRLPEAFSVKMLVPFMKDPLSAGGLGLSTEQVGWIYGTVGTIALTVGGILGGILASRYGLKKCLWPMALSLALPCAVYLYLAVAQPHSLVPIYLCITLDQFGYGLGFTAYTLYMLYFSRGSYQTSHYAFCTVLMTFSMLLPGLVAGKLQMSLGYTGFFVMVLICCLVTVGATLLVKVDPEYGKK